MVSNKSLARGGARSVRRKSNRLSSLALVGGVFLVFLLMILYVWLKVESDLLSAELRNLKIQESHLLVENENLKAEVARLSSFGRIQKIAQEILGLVFLPNEDIIEISEQ